MESKILVNIGDLFERRRKYLIIIIFFFHLFGRHRLILFGYSSNNIDLNL